VVFCQGSGIAIQAAYCTVVARSLEVRLGAVVRALLPIRSVWQNLLEVSIMQVAICIATFRRPRRLQKLLNGIAELRFLNVAIPELTVIVVDNDADGTAREACRSSALPWRTKYVVEPRRGIAEARNRGLREIGTADFVAFIDDDEVPNRLWLDELLSVQGNCQADAVAGPVYPSFTDDVPEWIRTGDFFNRPAHLTGEFLACCSTGNALVTRKVFDRVGAFDDRFQLTGGEDLHFFTRVRLAGFKIVWSQEAVVTETIYKDRANLGSLLRRAYRGGNSYTLVESSLNGSAYVRFIRFSKGCVRILQGAVNAGAFVLACRATPLVRALGQVCCGAGMLAGLAGLRYQAYEAVSGDSVEKLSDDLVIVGPEISSRHASGSLKANTID
jgi:succinoglycan biosynthesis protein ExoM